MTDKKEDLRIKRTRKLLSDSMFSLLETKSFDEISIIDICEKAMVHRATFYKHFDDKYDFIEQITNAKLIELYQQSLIDVDTNDKKSVYKSIIRTITTYVAEHKQMFALAAGSSNLTYFSSTIKILNESLVKFIEESDTHAKLQYPPADIIGAFLTGGIISLLNWWISAGDQYSPEDIQRYLENILVISEDSPDHPFS